MKKSLVPLCLCSVLPGGVREGWLHPDFIYVAEQGLKGMMKKSQMMVM